MELRGRRRANKPQSGLFSRHYYSRQNSKKCQAKGVQRPLGTFLLRVRQRGLQASGTAFSLDPDVGIY